MTFQIIDEKPDMGDRRGYLGGSDAAAVAGRSPWKSKVTLWLEKTGQLPERDLGDDERVRWGKLLEPLIIQEYARQTGQIVTPGQSGCLDGYPHLYGHTDAMVGEDGILEVKACGWDQRDFWGKEGTDAVPDQYLLQGYHYMMVFGRKWIDYAVLFGGSHLSIFHSEWNDEYITGLFNLEQEFWARVQAGPDIANAPPPQTAEEARQLWRKHKSAQVPAPASAIDAAARFKALKATIDKLTEEQSQAEFEILSAIKDQGDILVDGDRRIATWKADKNGKRTLKVQ